MTAQSPLFADDCASTCATANCLVVGQIAQPGDIVNVYLPGDASVVAVQVRNIGVGTLGFQMSADGVDWVPTEMFSQPGDVGVTSTQANGVWRGSVAGMSQFRVASDVAYAGSIAEVTIRVSPADLFVDPEATALPVELDAVPIEIAMTGQHIIVPAQAGLSVHAHRLKLSASDLVRVRFESTTGVALSGWETCDSQMLDLNIEHPWYETPFDEGFRINVLLADGTGAAPTLPVVIGGTLWYTMQPPPVVLP